MKQRRTAIVGLLGALSLLLFSGCDFEHPPGSKSGAAVDQRFAGHWVQTNVPSGKQPVNLTVERTSPSMLSAVLGTGFRFIAYRTDLPAANVLQVESLDEGWHRRYAVVVATFEGDRLRLRRVARKDAKLTTQQQVRAYVETALRHGPFANDLIFERQGSPLALDDNERLAADCDRGVAASCSTLGYRYAKGKGVAQDTQQAAALYRKACDAGEQSACTNLGVLYAAGDGLAQDQKQAAELYRRACDSGSGVACSNLARLYQAGAGVEKDEARASALMQRACKQGDRGACKDTEVAKASPDRKPLDQLTASCDRGNYVACTELGLLYLRGQGVAKDVARALGLFESGCDGGNGLACHNLAVMLNTGRGVKRDSARAARVYERACELGRMDSCSLLGNMAVNGNGIAKNIDRANALFRKACDGGSLQGCTNLGVSYATGRGVPEDAQRAAQLYQRACSSGSAESCSNLGHLYVRGRGVPKDISRARSLLTRACDKDIAVACGTLAKMQ